MLRVTRYSVKNSVLSPWVKFLWHLESPYERASYKLLPTNCIDVVLNLSNDMFYEVDCVKKKAPLFHVNCLREEHSFVHQEFPIRLFGISFFPYGLFPFSRLPMSEIRNTIFDLYELNASLAHKLANATTHDLLENVLDKIEEALCEELLEQKQDLDKIHLISQFLQEENSTTIQSFCVSKGIHIKAFERMAYKYTGYPPKRLRDVERFQNTSNQLVHDPPKTIAQLAYDNGFSDQSHLMKEFHRFSGSIPGTFKQEKNTVKENIKYRYR